MPALAVRDGPAAADELLKLLRDAGKIAAVEPLILMYAHLPLLPQLMMTLYFTEQKR